MKTTSHELKLTKKGLETFCLHLEGAALIRSKPCEGRTQYLMPDGKTRLQIRNCGETNYLDITTTTLFKPRYVRKLISSLHPHDNSYFGGSSSSPNKPMLSVLYEIAEDHIGETQ